MIGSTTVCKAPAGFLNVWHPEQSTERDGLRSALERYRALLVIEFTQHLYGD